MTLTNSEKILFEQIFNQALRSVQFGSSGVQEEITQLKTKLEKLIEPRKAVSKKFK